MFYENELRFLQKMLHKCHVSSAVINPDTPFEQYAETSLMPLTQQHRHTDTFYDMIPDIQPATVYRLMDVFFCRYIFMKLPFTDTPSVLLIGPYLHTNLTQQQILEQAERMKVPPEKTNKVELFYSSVPVIKEEHHLFAMVNTFMEYVFNGEDNFNTADLYFDQSTAALLNFSQDKFAESDSLDAEVMEARYRFENALIDAVSQGNAHKAELMMANFSTLSFETRTSDPLRNMKNYCVIMNTLMRKAAEKGHVHPIHLDRLSSNFARRIEALRTLNSVTDFMMEMMRSYCRLVKRYSMQNHSPLVQKAMICIEDDLTGDLSLSTMAAKNNVSTGYLSGLFKKETGQTYTAYVNNRRIAMAKHLLKTTHLQIQTIAQHCGILDFHYFCRLFKNSVGITPTEYRAKQIYDQN